MKKITLLLLLFFSTFLSYSQWTEGFESGIPTTWTVFDNGVGTAQSWGVTNLAANVYAGTQSAEVNRGNIGQGFTSEDWLVTPLQTNIATNAQLRFFSRSQLTGDTGTLYQIRLSSVSATGPTDVASYTIIKTYTELELSAVANVYEEKLVSLAAYAGQNRYIAFVRVHTQVGPSTSGDKWLLDDVKMTQQCFDPTVLTATNIGSQSAVLGWTNPAGAPLFDVEYGLSGFTQGTGTVATSVTNPYTAVGLIPNSTYQYYVRALCSSGTNSAWAGPFNFTTKPLGSVCADPIPVTALPYQVTADNTSNYGDEVDVLQGSLCGATPATTNYLAGDEVFYSFTATTTGLISITMTPVGATSTNSSLFVYSGCANVGVTCLGGVANATTAPRVVNLTVTAGQTYVIVISSSAGTQAIGYNLLIQAEDCVPKPTALAAANMTLNSADLSWTSTGFSSWQVSVQPLGSPIPSGAGTPVTSNPYTAPGLTAATQYQYWVRAECTPGSGIFTAWAGPFAFNTLICNPVDACLHTFKMTDSANNGWNGALMQVRQNGIVVATIGSTYTTGAGPVNVTVPLCHNVPFDLYWSTGGTQPQQCVVAIINSFGQTIYTKIAGASNPGQVVYTNTVDCITPRCDLPPVALTATLLTTTTATLGWTAPATTTWDIYLVPSGSPAPNATTVPTYDNVTVNPFLTTIPLTADTTYDFYVRVECAPFPSTWAGPQTFTTLPTCPKPTALTVAAITTTSATFGWTNGTPTDTAWEILLVPSPTTTLPTMLPSANPVLTPGMLLLPTNGPSPVTVTTLTPATIYFYYIRTVCSTTDSSTWSGPFLFNTVTCDPATKCNYKFVLTDTANNGWNGARMQVRQNGILIATIGATITGSGPTTVLVGLCPGVPFDLYWNIAGTAPAEVGLTIQNPFTDIIYTKIAGDGTPLTVLYSSTGNCTAPSCPKPTALTVTTNITQNSAELSWTESGTAIQWEVYVAPVGSPAPVNGTAVSGVNPYYIANSNPFTVTGLLPATQYIYYVRAICSTTDVGTWTILNPKTFTTKPLNDECAAAIPVPVNPAQVCLQNVASSTLGGTASTPTLTGAGCTTSDDDVWFSFVATNDIHIINLNTIVGTPTSVTLNHTLFSGTCAALTNIYCSTALESVAVGLTIGQTYFIRVYTAASTAGQFANFNICIKTAPAPATNNECATAIPVVVNTNAKCTLTTPGNIIGATGSLPSPLPVCTGNPNDDVWFSFVATSPTHYLSLLNVAGTTTNLNHAVYSGTCTNLVQKYCSAAGLLTSNSTTFIVGQTYYIRVWSNSAASQVVTFDVCVKSVSTCANADPFCGSSITDPYIFENTTGITPGDGQIACLFTTPNPAYFTLHVGQTGPLVFNILQNTQFNAAGNPVGTNLDVDFVAWGPFTSPQSCAQISFAPCAPTPCPNNTTNPAFYPVGNIIDCSYSGSFTETLTIPNAVVGQYYIILVTNFNGQAGFIRLVQTNFGATGAGETICCNVDLGPDQSLCSSSTTLNALFAVQDLANVPSTYQWFLNGSATPIPGATSSTYLATQSGVYTVVGNCGLNIVEDEITVILAPPITTSTPPNYVVCDVVPNDGFSSFDLNTLTPQVLGSLDPAAYVVTYHLSSADAIADSGAINTTIPFINTIPFNQTIYIRVESTVLATCYNTVSVQLVVTPLPIAEFNYGLTTFCQNGGNPSISFAPGGSAGTFSITPATGLSFDNATGAINLATSTPGTYTIINSFVASGGCPSVVSSNVVITITAPSVATFSYNGTPFCQNATNPNPVFSGGGVAGVFSSTTGLVINSVTGQVNLSASTPGTYLVTNTIPAQNGCNSVSATATIVISPAPQATIAYDASSFCFNQANQAVTLVGTAGGSYSATPPGLSINSNTGEINVSSSTAGSYLVSYTISAAVGCQEFIATTPVTIIPGVAVEVIEECEGPVFTLSALPISDSFIPANATYEWTGPSGFVFGPSSNPSVVLQVPGDYISTVTYNGCKNITNYLVTNTTCTIQKGISPNGDGDNESFLLTDVKKLQIYNRYGLKVYSFVDYTNQWHGQTDSGSELPDGTYYYIIERGNGDTLTGWIYINR